MAWETTATGSGCELKVQGFGRFIGAAFLATWLAGWAVGEAFGISMFAIGGWSLVTGRPGFGHQPVTLMAAVPVGLFLLIWLSFWTFGGITAGRELLRLLFGRDRFVIRQGDLEVEHSVGLFRSRELLSRQEVRRFYQSSAGAALNAETTRGTKLLTRLGSAQERAELENALNKEFNIPSQPATSGALPKVWCEETSLEHDPVLLKDPAIRRKQARTAWIVFAILSLLLFYFLATGRDRPDYIRGVILMFILSAAAGWGAFWLSFTRIEWRLDKGRVTLQRRFGQNRKVRFEAATLELIEDNSGEHGTNYCLQAAAVGAPPLTGIQKIGGRRRTIYSQTNDPTEPRNFGLWLSQRCQIPFADLTTADAKVKDLEALKQQLAASGRFGRVMVGVIERLGTSAKARGEG